MRRQFNKNKKQAKTPTKSLMDGIRKGKWLSDNGRRNKKTGKKAFFY